MSQSRYTWRSRHADTPAQFFPPLIFTLAAVYFPSFFASYLVESKYELVDEVDVTVKEAVVPNVSDGTGAVVAEEVDVEETIAVKKRPLGIVRTLLMGAPNPRSFALSLATLLLNVATIAMVADRVYSERYYDTDDLSFVRLGYVSEDAVKLLIREPDQSKMPMEVHMRPQNPVPPFEDPTWRSAGGVRWTSPADDYTALLTIPVKNAHGRTYEWTSTNNHSGQFTLPPRVGQTSVEKGGKFTFLATSCIISRLPYNPLDHPLAIPGMRHLADLLPDLKAQFMLFLGDFIYADVPRWWGRDVEGYRQKYRNVYASPEWAPVGQNLSWIHVLDDHEIRDDWSSNRTGIYEAAVDPWQLYHTRANPPPARRAGTQEVRPGATYFEFTQGPASFFMLDTRSYRSSNWLPFEAEDKTMLGADQLEDFLAYLRRPEPQGVKWKVVASSVPFTKNWPVNTQDTWGGFMHERRLVLEAMWDVAAKGVGVIVLSGDRHEFAATKFPPPVGGRWPADAAVHEFSASPLNQFYGPVPTYYQKDDEDVKIKYASDPACSSLTQKFPCPC